MQHTGDSSSAILPELVWHVVHVLAHGIPTMRWCYFCRLHANHPVLASSLQTFPDCSLRQGADGTEFARFGSRTSFLRWFYMCSQTYLGQKSEEHCFSIKNRCLEVKDDGFWEKCVAQKDRWSKVEFLTKFLDASAWFCVEKLKKHILRPKKLKNTTKIIEHM